jgi:apoptosis-inducing factor 3
MEAIVARVGDWRDGEMKEVQVGETKVLLTRLQGKFHAVGSVCTHYGGPLAEGVLSGDRVYCPWHQSIFNAISGDLEEPPGFDAVPRFEVRVEGDQIVVVVPDDKVERRTPAMCRCDSRADGRTFVILGAGGAGNAAAETLRQVGFKGKILMITREQALPYDRPLLSKGYLSGEAGAGWLPWRTPEFYRDHDIVILQGKEIAQVDTTARTIMFADGASLDYDAALVATGGVALRLAAPGADLANIFTLRSPVDADKIIAAAGAAQTAVAVGASFIGLETAASLTKRGVQVTVVAPGAVPVHRILGPEIGRALQKVHEGNGVKFVMGSRVASFEGAGRVQTVVLDNGERLPADLVIAGIGVKPATDFLQGIKLNLDSSVPVDKYLQAAPGLYAAGDMARFPDWRTGESIRIEHWRLALQHGRLAARNMAGRPTEFAGVPFFWSDQFDVIVQYVGYAASWDEIIFHGNPDDHDFLGFYVRDGQVRAAAAMNRDRQMGALAELLRLGQAPSPEELRRGSVDLVNRL